VCKTAVNPISALSFVRATSVSVSETAWKRRLRQSSAALAEQRVELAGDREDDLEVEDGEEDCLLGLGPEFLFEDLALGAVAVSAGVVGLAGEATARAHLEMAPEPGAATGDDVAHGPSLFPSELQAVRVITQDVGDFGAFGPAGLYDRARHGLPGG